MSSDSMRVLAESLGAVRGKGVQSESTILHFGDPATESAAAFESAAVGLAEERRLLRVTGADRARFLHNFCTSDILSLAPGETREAFFCDVKARIVAHAWIVASDDCHFVDLWSSAGTDLLTHLDRYHISEDVQLEYADDEHCALVLIGPRADALASEFQSQCMERHATPTSVKDRMATIRISLQDSAGFVFWIPAAHATSCWNDLISAGATAVGELTLEGHRILAGIPRVGVDVTQDHLAPEANRNAQAINYAKGCYLGQEPIARIDALGHVNRALTRIVTESVEDIPTESDVQSENGESLGSITSSVVVPFQNRAAGLAVLPLRKLSGSGHLQIAISTQVLVPAEIL